MKTYNRYTEGFKEQALVKVYNRTNDQTIEMVANELNINVTTLKESKRASNKTASSTSKRPKDGVQKNDLPRYEVQLTQLDPLNANTCYWVRLRAIGTNGPGLWAAPINIIVV